MACCAFLGHATFLPPCFPKDQHKLSAWRKGLGTHTKCLFYTRHYYWRTLFRDHYNHPSHIPLCRVKFVFLVGICPRHGCHESQRLLLSVSSTLLGRLSPFSLRLWVLYPNPTSSATGLVFSAAQKDLTIQKTTVSVRQHSSGHVITNTVP